MSERQTATARGERVVVPEVPLGDAAPSMACWLGRSGRRPAAARRWHAFVHRGPRTRTKGRRKGWGSPRQSRRAASDPLPAGGGHRILLPSALCGNAVQKACQRLAAAGGGAAPLDSQSLSLGDPRIQALARCRIGRLIRRRRDRCPPGAQRPWESLAPPPANRQTALFGFPRRRRE
jgi:hypothetical protein